jgi:hydroxyacylglutathione hydrolase
LKNTSEVRILQVKHAARRQFPTRILAVRPVRAVADNYIWLISTPRNPSRLVAVHHGDAASVLDELQRSGASLAAILLTHNHSDHIGGVPELLRHWDVPVIGPDDARIAKRTPTARAEFAIISIMRRYLAFGLGNLLINWS